MLSFSVVIMRGCASNHTARDSGGGTSSWQQIASAGKQRTSSRAGHEIHESLARFEAFSRSRDCQSLIYWPIQSGIDLQYGSSLLQHKRKCGECNVRVARGYVLLRHADTVRVCDFGLHLIPNT